MIAKAPVNDPEALDVARTHHARAPRTRAACEAAIALGVTLDDLAPHAPEPVRFRLRLPERALTLVVGPSGSGKSTLLNDAAHAAEAAGWTVVRPPAHARGPRPCVDRFKHARIEDRLRALAATGLAEARRAVAPPAALSTGELERLRLALGVAKAELLAKRRERVLLVVDELGAGLDGATASAVACALARVSQRHPRVRVLVATNRADVHAELRPSATLRLDSAARLVVDDERPGPAHDPFVIETGERADVAALAHHHYRPGMPATIVRVSRAVDTRTGELAGVLSISMPTLNASWRKAAWEGAFTDANKRIAAQRINEGLRTISRVIVAPEHRARGLAVRMVRAYLRDPITPCTEAIAAMGHACPFFERAGMTPHGTQTRARDRRLLDFLSHAGVRERWRLATPDTALARAVDHAGRAGVDRAVRSWATGSRASASSKGDPLESLFERACRTIATLPVVYTHRAG